MQKSQWNFCCSPCNLQEDDKQNSMMMAIHKDNINGRKQYKSPEYSKRNNHDKITLKRKRQQQTKLQNYIGKKTMKSQDKYNICTAITDQQNYSNQFMMQHVNHFNSANVSQLNSIKTTQVRPATYSPRVMFTYRSPQKPQSKINVQIINSHVYQPKKIKDKSSLIDTLLQIQSSRSHSRKASQNNEYKKPVSKGKTYEFKQIQFMNNPKQKLIKDKRLKQQPESAKKKGVYFSEDIQTKLFTKKNLVSVKEEKSIDLTPQNSLISNISSTVSNITNQDQSQISSKIDSKQDKSTSDKFGKKNISSIRVFKDWTVKNQQQIRKIKKHNTCFVKDSQKQNNNHFHFKTVETINEFISQNEFSTVDLKFMELRMARNVLSRLQ